MLRMSTRPMTNEAPPGCEVARRDRLIAVSGQADFDSLGQVAHPGDARAQVVAVVGRVRERLERVGADLSDLAKLIVFHVPEPGCGEREMRDLLARALGPDVLTTLTMVPLPRLVSPGLLIAVDAYAMRGAAGGRIERAPLEVPGLASLPEPFCHGLRCDEFIFTSGQSALDERGRGVVRRRSAVPEPSCAGRRGRDPRRARGRPRRHRQVQHVACAPRPRRRATAAPRRIGSISWPPHAPAVTGITIP